MKIKSLGFHKEDLCIVINDWNEQVSRRIFDLVWTLSQERDYWKELADREGSDND